MYDESKDDITYTVQKPTAIYLGTKIEPNNEN